MKQLFLILLLYPYVNVMKVIYPNTQLTGYYSFRGLRACLATCEIVTCDRELYEDCILNDAELRNKVLTNQHGLSLCLMTLVIKNYQLLYKFLKYKFYFCIFFYIV